MALATLAGMMLGLFASALAPNSSSAPLIVIMLMLPQIVLGGALVPLPTFVSAPTATRWAFEALMSITGPGSDLAADKCWELPPDVRAAMTLDDKKANGCNCMGLNMLKEDSCNFPGLGKFYDPAVDEPQPIEPAPLPPPPPEPVVRDQPVQPVDQSDTVAMAQYFDELQKWQAEVTGIQADYKQKIEAYQAQSEVYKSEIITYQQSYAAWQVGQGSAVSPAEFAVGKYYNDLRWTVVNKNDTAAYLAKITKDWMVQLLIIFILFGAILVLQKRKDVT